jgi:hypothetical protein
MKRFFVFFVAVLAIIGCDDSTNPDSKTYDVSYRVSGTAPSVNITMTNQSGGTSQFSDVSLPWSHSFSGKSGDFVYLSAQNQGQYGTVTVKILRDFDVIEESTATIDANEDTPVFPGLFSCPPFGGGAGHGPAVLKNHY